MKSSKSNNKIPVATKFFFEASSLRYPQKNYMIDTFIFLRILNGSCELAVRGLIDDVRVYNRVVIP